MNKVKIGLVKPRTRKPISHSHTHSRILDTSENKIHLYGRTPCKEASISACKSDNVFVVVHVCLPVTNLTKKKPC